MWKNDKTVLAHYLQSAVSNQMQIDIHPNATLGQGLMLDHGTGTSHAKMVSLLLYSHSHALVVLRLLGIVVGETARVGVVPLLLTTPFRFV